MNLHYFLCPGCPDEHPQAAMRNLGLTWSHAVPQTMGDQWWFFNVRGALPDPLPSFLKPMTVDVQQLVGCGLSKEQADDISALSTKPSADPSELVWAGGWIACADRMPTPGVTVLAYYRNEVGNGRRIRAQWVPAKTREGDGDLDDLDLVYDEDADTCYWPEGWYEQIDNWAEYTSIVVTEGEVTHWHAMPDIDAAMGDAPEAKGGRR